MQIQLERYSWRCWGDAAYTYILVCMYIEGIVLIDTTGTYAAGANCAGLGWLFFKFVASSRLLLSLVWLPLDITVSLPLLPLAASPFPLPPLFWLQSAVLALDLWPTATLVRQTLWPSAASHATSARDKRSSFSCLLPPPPFLPLCHPFHCFICVVVAKNRSNAHCIRLLCCRGYWTQYIVSKFCRRR